MPYTRHDLDLLEDNYFRWTNEEQGVLDEEGQKAYRNYLSWIEMRKGEITMSLDQKTAVPARIPSKPSVRLEQPPATTPVRSAQPVQSPTRVPAGERLSVFAGRAKQTAGSLKAEVTTEVRQLGKEAKLLAGELAGQVKQKIREARTPKPEAPEVPAGPREVPVRKITRVEQKVANIEIEDTIASNATSIVRFTDRWGRNKEVMIISDAVDDINRVRILNEEGNEIRMGHVADVSNTGVDIELFAVNIDFDRNGNIELSPYKEASRSPRLELVFSNDKATDETVSRISFVSRQDFRRKYQVNIEELQAGDMRVRAVQEERKFASGSREHPRRIQRTFYRHEPIVFAILGQKSSSFILPEKILSATEDLQLLDEYGNAYLLHKVKPQKLFPYRGLIQNKTYSALASNFKLKKDDSVFQLTFKPSNDGWQAVSEDFADIRDAGRQIYIIRRQNGKKEVVIIDQSGKPEDQSFRKGIAVGRATRDEEIQFERAFETKAQESKSRSVSSEAPAVLSGGSYFEINLNDKRYTLVWNKQSDEDPFLMDENGKKLEIFGIDPGLSDRIGQYYLPIQGLNLPKDARRFGFTLREGTEETPQIERISLGKLLGRVGRSPSLFVCLDVSQKTRAFLLTPPQDCIEISEIAAGNQAFSHYENVARGTHEDPDAYRQIFPESCDQIVVGSLIGDSENVREVVITRIRSDTGATQFQATNLASGEIIRTPGAFKRLSTLIDRYALSGNPMLIDLSARLGDSRNAVFTMEIKLDDRRPFSYQSPARMLDENRKNHLADVVVVEDHSTGQLLSFIIDESLGEVRSGSIMNSGTGIRIATDMDMRLVRIKDKIRRKEKTNKRKFRIIPIAAHTAVSAASIAVTLGFQSYFRPIEPVVMPSGETKISFSLPVVRFIEGEGMVSSYARESLGDYIPPLTTSETIVLQSLLPSSKPDTKVGNTYSVISEGEVQLTWNNVDNKYIPPAYSTQDVDGVHRIPEGFGEQINVFDENDQQITLLGSRNTVPFLSVTLGQEVTLVQNLQVISADGNSIDATFGTMADGTLIKANNAGNLIYKGDPNIKIYRTPFHDGVPQFLILNDGQIVGFAPREETRQSIYLLNNPSGTKYYAQDLTIAADFQKIFGLTISDFDADPSLEKSLTFNLASPQRPQLAITEKDGVLVYQNLYNAEDIYYPDFGSDREGNQLKAYATPYCYGILTCNNIYAIPTHDDLPTIFVLEDGTFLGVQRDAPGLLPDPNAAVFRTNFDAELSITSLTSDADLFQKLNQAGGREVVLSEYRYEPYELVTPDGNLYARKSYDMTRILSNLDTLSIKPNYIPAVYQTIEKDNRGNQVETHKYFIINSQNGRIEYVAYGLVDEFGDGRNVHPQVILRRGLTIQREVPYSSEAPNPNKEILQREVQRVRDHIQWYLDAYELKNTVDEVFADPSLINDAGINSRIQYLRSRLAQPEPETINISGSQIVQRRGRNVWSLWESDIKDASVIRIVDPQSSSKIKSLLIPVIQNEVGGRQWTLVYEEAQITPFTYQRPLLNGGFIDEPLYVIPSTQIKREKTDFVGMSTADYLLQNNWRDSTIEYLDSYGKSVAYAVDRGIDKEIYDEMNGERVLSGRSATIRTPNIFLTLNDQGNPVYAYFGEAGINPSVLPITFSDFPTPYNLGRADFEITSRGENIKNYQTELESALTSYDPLSSADILTEKGELLSLNDQKEQEMTQIKEMPIVIMSLIRAEEAGLSLDDKIFVYSGGIDPYSGSFVKKEIPLSEVIAKVLEGGLDKQKYLDGLLIRFNLGAQRGDRSSIHTEYDIAELNHVLSDDLNLTHSTYFQDSQTGDLGYRSSPYEMTKLTHDLFAEKIISAEALTLLENLLLRKGETSLISTNPTFQIFDLVRDRKNSQGMIFEIIKNGDQRAIVFSFTSDLNNAGNIANSLASIIQRLQGGEKSGVNDIREYPLEFITINEYSFRKDQIFTSPSGIVEQNFHDIVNKAINENYSTGEEFVLAINQAMNEAGYGELVSSKSYQEQIDLIRRDYRKIKKQPVQCISFAGIQKAFVEFYGGKLPNITGLTREDGSRITAAEHYIDTDFDNPKVQYAQFWNITEYRVLKIDQINEGDYLVTRDGHIAYVTKVLITSDGPLVIIDQANRNNDGKSTFDALNKNNIEQKLDPFGQLFILRGADNKLPPSTSSSPQGSLKSPHARASLMPGTDVEPSVLAKAINPRLRRQDRLSVNAQLRGQEQRASLIPRRR